MINDLGTTLVQAERELIARRRADLTGRKAGKIRLLPWYTERDTAAITSYAAEAADALRSAAIAALGPDNPLAQQLLAEQQRGDEQTTRHEGTVR